MPTSVYVGPQNINILKTFKTLLFRNIDPIYPPIRSLEGSGTPLQYSCLENPMDGGAW